MIDLVAKAGAKKLDKAQKTITKDEVIVALKKIEDPEIMINIYDMGLIYDIKIDDCNNIEVTMTLTAPNCPVAQDLPDWIADGVAELQGVGEVQVFLTFEPSWNESLMTDEAREMIGIF